MSDEVTAGGDGRRRGARSPSNTSCLGILSGSDRARVPSALSRLNHRWRENLRLGNFPRVLFVCRDNPSHQIPAPGCVP